MRKAYTILGKIRIGLLCITAAAFLFLQSGCDNETGWNSEKIQPPPAGSRLSIQVEAVTVYRGDVYAPIMATGTICPADESKISAKVLGRIENTAVEEGDKVKEDQILARLEVRDFELACNSAKAHRDMIRANMKEAEVNRTNLVREKERIRKLYERKVVSQQSYDEANTACEMADAKCDVLAAQLKAAQADLELSERRLEDSCIRAPFSGYIADKFANEGEVISPGAPIFLIQNIDRVEAEVKIPEVELTRIFIGSPVEVRIDALPGQLFGGSISIINASIDPVNRNFKIKIEIENTDHLLKPGMFARITIKTDTKKNVIIVPGKALVTDSAGNDAVFILEDGRAFLRRVITGSGGAGMVEIKEGLTEGQKVLVTGNYGLADGSEVEAKIVDY
ncbi:MAG: efflux RND transporter periplasmic adaptor subunit [Syntrophales bacterium]|jgi:RND family efflux transporter MFP subunit|nr:efflux RND transporter periplasmic adaptor subunit [Syntrophales bacterium]MDY0044044.1 efflux RND transporter periplasmic adaptor subunit [Syntrophales bacterium]